MKRYGRVEVLSGLSMDVRDGDVYGFLGRNGSGKTTTLRICMGIVTATSGEIEILGARVARPTVAQKREIGYVSQEPHFYPWMSCDSIGRFVRSFYPAWDAAEFARLLHVLDLPPERKVAQLSGGMRAKLGLALALAHRPRLLLLDEPTAGLDPAARREFLEIVRVQARAGGHTTVFSSHIVEEVERVAGRVGILDRGRLVHEGSIDALLASVRRLDLAPPTPRAAEDPSPGPPWPAVPPAFETISDFTEAGRRTLILRARPGDWDAGGLPAGRVSAMSLEDVFLALTVGRVVRA